MSTTRTMHANPPLSLREFFTSNDPRLQGNFFMADSIWQNFLLPTLSREDIANLALVSTRAGKMIFANLLELHDRNAEATELKLRGLLSINTFIRQALMATAEIISTRACHYL